MARPNKSGFTFYKSDTERFRDRKIRKLVKSFGTNGYAVYEYVLNEIYRDKGCFLEWDEDTAFDVAEYYGIKETLVLEIVRYCCAVGLFDKELLTSERLLTSRSIQERYVEACTIMKRTIRDVPDRIKLPPKIPEKTIIIPEEMAFPLEETPKTLEESTRTKRNVTKRNRTPPTPPGGEVGVCVFPFDENSPVMVRVREVIPDPKVREAFREFVRVRYDDGHKISETSVDRHLKRLLEISTDPQKQLALIDLAIVKNWKTIFPEPPPPATGPPKSGKRTPHVMTKTYDPNIHKPQEDVSHVFK